MHFCERFGRRAIFPASSSRLGRPMRYGQQGGRSVGLCRYHGQINEYGDGHNIKEHMQRIRRDAVALRQKGMCPCIHRAVASGSLWIRASKIRDPTRRERTVTCKSIGDPQPPKDPPWVGATKIKGGGSKSDRNRSEID